MAQDKNSIIFYKDWKDIFESLNDKDCAELIRHIFRYINDEKPKSNNPLVNAHFLHIRNSLKRDLAKWEGIRSSRSEAGRIGGKQTQAKSIKHKQNQSNQAVSVSDSVSVTVSDSVTEKKEEIFIIIDEEKIFDALPIMEYYEVQLNGMQKENHNLSWAAMVPNWLVEHSGEEFKDRLHAKNSFKKYYFNKLKVDDWKSAKKNNGANSPKFSGDYSEAL